MRRSPKSNDCRPPLQSFNAGLTRRNALGLAASVAVGGLAASTRSLMAFASDAAIPPGALPARASGPQQQPWAAELTAVVTEFLKRSTIPGVVLGVWQDGQPDYVQAFGVQDTATRRPMTPDLYMRIGSNTKSF